MIAQEKILKMSVCQITKQLLYLVLVRIVDAYTCVHTHQLTKLAVINNISIFHVCMVWIEKSVTRVTDRHHEACRVMPNSDPE